MGVLVSESLLAAAQGKLPQAGARVAAVMGRRVLEELESADRGPIELALAASDAAGRSREVTPDLDGGDINEPRMV